MNYETYQKSRNAVWDILLVCGATQPVILYNDTETPQRIRFTMCDHKCSIFVRGYF